MVAYAWPGNVRQLRHLVERLVATLADGVTITAADVYKALPAATLGGAMPEVPIFNEKESLDAYLDRTLLNLYEHFVAKTSFSPGV
jgi:transcriptional regulator with PAS, ATPase and Fis domain